MSKQPERQGQQRLRHSLGMRRGMCAAGTALQLPACLGVERGQKARLDLDARGMAKPAGIEKKSVQPSGDKWHHYKLLQLDLPAAIVAQRTEIVSNQKEGLIAYQGSGVDSGWAKSETMFDFSEGVAMA